MESVLWYMNHSTVAPWWLEFERTYIGSSSSNALDHTKSKGHICNLLMFHIS